MKKLMITFSAALIAGICAAEIQSSNVVGYTQPSTTKESVSWTPMFTVVNGSAETYKLSDFSASGMQYDADMIQFLDEDTAATYLSATYLNAEDYGEDMAGWWDYNGSFSSDEDRLDGQTFAYGTSFLALFGGDGEITLKFSGEVIKGERTFTFEKESPFFGNYLPVDIKLKDITCTGMQYDADMIQFLDEDTAATYLSATYLNADDYGEDMAGWWDYNGSFSGDEDRLDETPVPAGQGFLGLFGGENVITVTFPSAY